jgi:hypothetical protein
MKSISDNNRNSGEYGMKMIILGHKEHGKTTFAKLAKKHFGIDTLGTSLYAAEAFMFERLKDKYGYTSVAECHADRVNHRQEWFEDILDYNTNELCRLIRESLEKVDMVEGVRARVELLDAKAKGLADLYVWIDASERKPAEDSNSSTVTKEDATVILSNNGSESEFEAKVIMLLQAFYGTRKAA